MKDITLEIIRQYKSGLAGYKIAEKLGLSSYSVYKILERKELTRTNKENYKVIFNDTYFQKINTEKKAYFLGLLAADGCVIEPKQSSPILKIDLKEDDAQILFLLAEELELSRTRLKRYKYKEPNSFLVRLLVPSEQIVLDLEQYGIIPRKTFSTYFPSNIPKDLERHFIRGYFDGDGCITVGPTIKITGTSEILLEVQNILVENCFLGNKTKLQTRFPERENNIRSLEIGGKLQVSRIYNYLYDKASVYFERKKNRFMELLYEN